MNKTNLESLDTVERERERERERVSLYSTWNLSTRPHTHTDSLIELKINDSRDRKNLLFCVMQNSR